MSQIWRIMERKNQRGGPLEFSIRFVKLSTGQIVDYDRAVMTSIHTAGDTVNVMKAGECRPHKIKRILIVRFNGLKVYI